MKDAVDAVLRTGDSVGGVFEVVVHGVPPGLGTYANWDERLDGLLAASVMSLAGCQSGGDWPWRDRCRLAWLAGSRSNPLWC